MAVKLRIDSGVTLRRRWALLLALTIALSGCGGSESNSTPMTFDLAQAMSGLVANGTTTTDLVFNGSFDGKVVTGTGTFRATQAMRDSLQGVSSLNQNRYLDATWNDGAQNMVFTDVGFYFYDATTHALQGSALHMVAIGPMAVATGPVPGVPMPGNGPPNVISLSHYDGHSELDVPTAPIEYPTMVVVGSAGNLGMLNRYSNGSMGVAKGSVLLSYRIKPAVNAGSVAIVEFTESYFDEHQALEKTEVLDYSLDAGNGLALVSASVQVGTATFRFTTQ